MQQEDPDKRSGRDVDAELERLEKQLNHLRVQYEQYFLDIISFEPEELLQEVTTLIRQLQGAPFKNSVSRFKLRTLTQKLQTYRTYWERVHKEREEGRYRRDRFKAGIRKGKPQKL